MKYWPIALLLVLLIACGPADQPTNAKDVADDIAKQADKQTQEPKEQPQETTKQEPTKEQNKEPKEEPKKEPQSTEEPELPEITAEDIVEQTETSISKPQQRTKLYQFLDTFRENVDSYQFTYKQNDYYVRGTTYKIILDRPISVSHVSFGDVDKSLFYYDTIYLDRVAKTAIAYCEGHDDQVNRQCATLELYDLAYPVTFNDHDITLPEDWLLTYLDYEPRSIEANKYYVKNRAATTATFTLEPELQLHFDKSTGLVIRADLKDGDQLLERHDYENLVANKVSSADIRHRSKSEIPSEEVFY